MAKIKTQTTPTTAISTIEDKNFIIDSETKRITFLDSRFYFTKSGNYVPSVTTLLEAYPKSFWYYEWLKKVGQDADEIRDEAGRKGSVVHKMTEEYDGGLRIDLLDETGSPMCRMSEWAMFEKYIDFSTRFKPVVHYIELNHCCEELGWGGTLDRVLTLNGKNYLIDIKTGNAIYNHYWLQQAAYKELFEHYCATTKKAKKIEIDDVGILWLNAKTRTDGKGDAVQGLGWQLILRGDGAEKDMEVFRATKRLWEAEYNDSKPKNFTYCLNHKR